MLCMVVAYSANRGIGKDNKIPWNLKDDMKFFKNLTVNNIVIMGRKTYESIGKPLDNRHNIVVSNSLEKQEGIIIKNSLKESIEYANSLKGYDNIYIIGGQQIYNQSIDLVDKIYVTEVEAVYCADSFFPYIEEEKYNIEVNSVVENPIKHRFITYTKLDM